MRGEREVRENVDAFEAKIGSRFGYGPCSHVTVMTRTRLRPVVSLARLVIGAFLGAFLGPLVGCASPEEDDSVSASDEALSVATTSFDADMATLERLRHQCESEGRCEHAGGSTTDSGGVHLETEAPRVRDSRLCNALTPFQGLGHPYFFVGTSAKAAAIDVIDNPGFDAVWDLRNQQFAVFAFHGDGLENLVGVEANAYMGYAFGNKRDVLDAWSGAFESGEATVQVPVLQIGVGGAIFQSPDGSIFGGLVEASVGVNALGPLAPISASVSKGLWVPVDEGTRALGETFVFTSFHEQRAAAADGKDYAYVQFDNTRSLALSILERLGPFGTAPAAYAVALDALEKAGISYENACVLR